MVRSGIVWLMALCFSVALHALNCQREEERDVDRRGTSGDGGTETLPNENEEEAPDTLKDPPRFEDPDDVPDTWRSPGNPEYATYIILYAGCEGAPDVMAVAARQNSEPDCAHIYASAVREQGGNVSEVNVPFLWDISYPDIVSLEFSPGPTQSHARVRGKLDLFDGDKVTEPESAVWACAMNDCPQPAPSDCSDLVCSYVNVISVVNIEGTWTLTGVTFGPGATMHPLQDGRSFKDPVAGVKTGKVEAATVRFDIDDYEYSGTLSADRTHIAGSVRDLMNDIVIGSWSAERQGS